MAGSSSTTKMVLDILVSRLSVSLHNDYVAIVWRQCVMFMTVSAPGM